jgi:hypothetical protein
VSSILAHQLGAGEDVAAHRAIDVSPRCPGSQLKFGIECVQPEVVAMRRSRRRTGTAVSLFPEIVTPLSRAGSQRALWRDAFRQFAITGGQIVKQPMEPCSTGRIWIVP